MSNTEARIKISIKDGEFELSGSELFVSQQIENLREVIESALQGAHQAVANSNSENEAADNSDLLGPPAAPHQSETKEEHFTNVLHIEGDKVSIIKTMTGGNKAKKSVNTALAYLWGKKSVGLDEVPFGEIRELCNQQGCLDSANFSSHMKSARQYIIIEGKKGSSSKTCKLTLPGVEEAKRLLTELNGG